MTRIPCMLLFWDETGFYKENHLPFQCVDKPHRFRIAQHVFVKYGIYHRPIECLLHFIVEPSRKSELWVFKFDLAASFLVKQYQTPDAERVFDDTWQLNLNLSICRSLWCGHGMATTNDTHSDCLSTLYSTQEDQAFQKTSFVYSENQLCREVSDNILVSLSTNIWPS